MYIGQKIKEIREGKNLTQAQLALKAGVGQAYISKIENQTIREPSIAIVETIAMALGMSGRTLIEGTSFNSGGELARRKKGAGFCPNTKCPGSNYPEICETLERADDMSDLSPYVPPWEPYKTPLLDEEGEPIYFCEHCGSRLVTECRHCGRGIKRFYKYCPGCGHFLLTEHDPSQQAKPLDDDDVPL